MAHPQLAKAAILSIVLPLVGGTIYEVGLVVGSGGALTSVALTAWAGGLVCASIGLITYLNWPSSPGVLVVPRAAVLAIALLAMGGASYRAGLPFLGWSLCTAAVASAFISILAYLDGPGRSWSCRARA